MTAARVASQWHWSHSTDFKEADTELLQHKRLKICNYNHHLPVSQRERSQHPYRGSPETNGHPGLAASVHEDASYASLVTQKGIKAPILSFAVKMQQPRLQ